MIFPQYKQATCDATFSEKVMGKWYCSYFEELNGRNFDRYLHPDGWKKYAYWWNAKEECENTFQKFNQSHLNVEEFEVDNAIAEEEWYSDYLEQQFS
jgi:hypothetical protein